MSAARVDSGLKVLHVAETAQGGVGSYIEEVAPLQRERYGPDAVRIVLPAEHASHFKHLPPTALHTFSLANGRLLTMLRLARQTLAQVRRWQPDVVHVHSTYAGFVLRPLLAFLPARPRVVYCAHGWAFDRQAPRWVNRAVTLVERAWARWCDAVICISLQDRHSALRAGIDPNRLALVLNGIADRTPQAVLPSTLERWPPGRLRVLFVGRLDRQKGVDILQQVLERLGPRAATVVVGSAVVAGKPMIEPVPGQLQILGWLPRDEIAALYVAAHVVVMPSRWEGLPLVALEAMRAGCAVVASRVGGLPEVVEHGVTGMLVDAQDAPAMAACLEALDEPTLRAMGEAGRARFLRLFRIERVTDDLDTLYRQLLQPPQGAPLTAR